MVDVDFTLMELFDDVQYKFAIKERSENNEVSYRVAILEPEDFHMTHEIEYPLSMKYNPDNDCLYFDTHDDLSQFRYIETYLSNQIMSRNV